MKNSRRQFMILSAAGACTLALNGKVQAQAMVAETDPQAAALGTRLMLLKLIKQSTLSMLLANSVITALCTRVKLVQPLVVAHCSLVSKLLAKAGALLTLRRPNYF